MSVWLDTTLFMWFVATRSFGTVDKVLKKPSAPLTEASKTLSPDQTRSLLRFAASEINRTYFWSYGITQIALGALLLLLLWRQAPRDTISLAIVGAMLGLVLVLTLGVTPLVVSIGRRIDFVPRNPPPPVMPRFWMLHGAFTGLDALKFLAGLGLLIRWILNKSV